MKTCILIFVLLVTTCLYSTIINVPADQPTIQDGIEAAATGDTVLVAEGTYYENIDFIGKAITVASNFIIDGDEAHIGNTIINGSQPEDPDYGSCVRFMSGETINTTLKGFTLTEGLGTEYPAWGTIGGGICIESSSPTIINNNIIGNSANYDGGLGCSYGSDPIIISNMFSGNNAYSEIGGLDFYDNCNPYVEGNIIKSIGAINLYNSSGTFINNTIMYNQAESFGAGIHIWNNSSVDFTNCIIIGNSAYSNAGGFYISNSEVSITNCTISGNSCGNNGGGIYVVAGSDLTLLNTIVEGNEATIGAGIYFNQPGNIDISFSEFYNYGDDFGGSVPADLGDIVDVNANGDSCDTFMNIFLDPLFVDPANNDFHLTELSPCIDAGDPDSPLDPDGTITDIGRFYFEQVGTEDNTIVQTLDYLQQNYPNPFNPTTTISFSTTESTENTELVIYNLKGQKIKDLSPSLCHAEFVEVRGKSRYSVVWNGTDQNNKPVSSGIYFYKLKTDNFEKTKKMILLK